MSEQNKTNEWSTITSTLPDYCRKLEKDENGEWHDATPVNESDLILEEHYK